MTQPQAKSLTNNWKTSVQSKSILIAIAALALTATGAQAFSGDALVEAGLTDSQLAAFEVARELRAEGDTDAARDVLVEAGIDEKVLEQVRSALSSKRPTVTAAANYRSLFRNEIADDLTADQKAALTVARMANDRDAMNAILEEAGMIDDEWGGAPKRLRDGRALND